MKKRRRLNIFLVYALAQLAWLALLGLWIYWYVSNYMIFVAVGEKISPQIVFNTQNVVALVGGLLLLVAIATAMLFIFSILNEQMKVTGMYDTFIANVTHELKSPLASIQLYLETMRARDVPRERQWEFLDIMLKDAKRLNALINTILDISGLEEKKRVFEQRVYDAESLVSELISESVEQFNIPAGSVTFRCSGTARCKVDRSAMKVVFNNLFDNAIKYSSEPVRLVITMTCATAWLTVGVRDHGIGIAKEDQKEVFKKFRRLYNPESPSVKGTGLGLYWVREIVRHQRGRVSVDSEGRSNGTTFTIQLPTYRGKDSGDSHQGEPLDRRG